MELLFIGGIMMMLFALTGIFSLILTIAAIVDIVRGDFRNPNDKIIWLLVVIFVHFIGAILYFAIGKQQQYRR